MKKPVSWFWCACTCLPWLPAQRAPIPAADDQGDQTAAIFDLARFLFPWFMLPRRWRSSLFTVRPGESTRTVCSTMIAEAFGNIQFPILPLVKREQGGEVRLFMRNPRLCTPSDFDYSPYFEIIKYPFMDVHSYAEHRLLPWSGSGELTEEERQLYVTATKDMLNQ